MLASFAAVGEWVADSPPQVLAALGVRCDPLAGRLEPPHEAISVGSWKWWMLRWGSGWLSGFGWRLLARGRGRRGRRAVAVDGKAVRGTHHASSDGQPVHLLAALDQRTGGLLG